MPIFQPKIVKNKLEEVFADREPLDDQSFYQKYFISLGISQDIVIKVRHLLEEEFDVDLSRLAAEDDFAKNLSFLVYYGSLDAVEFVIRLEEEFDIVISDTEAE